MLYRQVNEGCRAAYEHLMQSGLYASLTASGALVAHEEASLDLAAAPGACRILRPTRIPFVSYPYEWAFSALQDAALLTLDVHRQALEHGMVLKDASAYNVQLLRGRPVFIDTLSFDFYREGEPWVAYRQFCQHFLAPLALMAHVDERLGRLLREFIDGVPLDLASRLLPARTRLQFGLLTHLHLHAKGQARHADASAEVRAQRAASAKVSRTGMLGMIDSLAGAVRKLSWAPTGTEWGEYYSDTNYSDEAASRKQDLVGRLVARIKPATVWDLGGNTGVFARCALAAGAGFALSFDVDAAAVEKAWLTERKQPHGVTPLLLDLTNPSPALGWAHQERQSLAARGPADLVMALALVHHLAISNNVPLPRVADYLAELGRHVLIEFVPKSDSQVRRLLAAREDVFPDYTEAGFRAAFARRFDLVESAPIEGSERVLLLYSNKSAVGRGEQHG